MSNPPQHRWVDEDESHTIAHMVGSTMYYTTKRPVPGSPQSYRNADDEPVGRVFPFNNGDGWRWCAVTYDEHSVATGEVFTELEAAKRHVELSQP